MVVRGEPRARVGSAQGFMEKGRALCSPFFVVGCVQNAGGAMIDGATVGGMTLKTVVGCAQKSKNESE